MQAFRADTTIDEQNALHIPDVPFQPGTLVEVIVLEHKRIAPKTASVMSPRLADPRDAVHFQMEVSELGEGHEDAEL
jgi:hypothetical protein